MNRATHIGRWLIVLSLLTLVCSELAIAQNKAPSEILNQYRAQRTTWFTAVWPFANTLFGLLAVIEFAWSAALMALEKTDLQSWTAALVRKVMWIGAFYALLIYGRYWIPAITDSFEIIGQRAAQTGPMSPSDVFMRGIDISGALMASSSTAAFFTNLGTSLAMIITGLITALAFIAITVQFVVAMVESYLIVAAGIIFVGFGGSRWTAPYVERYIGLGVSTGVKIMLLYLLIGTGMNLSVDWMTDAQKIAASATPAMSALEIMGASVIFMMLCWQIPKLFAAVLGGSPALTGGDLVSNAAFVAGGAVAVGSLGVSAAAGGAGLLGAGTAGGSGGSAAGVSGSSAIGGNAMLASAGGFGSGGTVPPPPAPIANSSGPQQPLAPLRSAAQSLTGMRRGVASQIPPDAGPHAAPPRMNIDQID
jgi:type IV secretion system protein TrbL